MFAISFPSIANLADFEKLFRAAQAVEGKCVTSAEGIIDDDVDRSIRNLTAIGREGMAATDRLVLDIMTHKKPADCER